MTKPTQFISLDRLATLLGMTDNHKARETVRRLTRDGIISKDDFRSQMGPKMAADFRQHSLPKVAHVTDHFPEGSLPKIGRGRPALAYFLSPVGALTLAMHVRTPEAAAWRRSQVMKLAGSSTPALPAHEPERLAMEVQDLRARVERLEARPTHGVAALSAHTQPLNIATFLDALPKGSEVRIADVACACGIEMSGGSTKALGIALARLGWQPIRRVRVDGYRSRVYRKTTFLLNGVH